MNSMAKEIKIALVAIVGILVLFFGMKFLKGVQLFSNDHVYYVTFSDISGLAASSPIYANGFKVGTVKSIEYDYSKPGAIVATVGLDKKLQVPNGSRAEIESDLLGNVKLNLLLGDPSAGMIPVGGKISGSIYAGALGKAAEMIPQIEKILPKLDSILANLNTLTADPAIAKSLHNVEHITNDLTTTTTQLNTLMASLNKEVPGMITRANNVLDQSGQLASNLSAVNVEETMTKVSETLENLRRFTDKLNANDGSLGLLLNDKKLYQNLNSTIAHADSLLINLREHPKRYVHFSVFGKKDK
ncbi:MlaD family protein [Prevotella sp. Rep29]|uniref:MlaD family protein n=1 Tax=Prevotella sp. Rep29 TaxID=2691580 RepID=UPI001C6ED9A4|nr:MlaD family protein [Prevotella sp. Rep29]QYR11709.1 MCE family protein [Prevotella sp. Rep29]